MILIIEISCLIIASFFAGMETGLLSADKLKIYSNKELGKIWANSAHFLLKKPERLLATTLIGTNVAVVTSAVVLSNYLRNQYSLTVAISGSMVLTIVYLLFSEIIPKTFFRRNADTITVRLAVTMHLFFYIFLPISFLLNLIVKILMILMKQKNTGEKIPRSRDDFRLLMHLSSKESGLGNDDFRIIDEILDFGLTLASEAMIPLHKQSIYHIDTNPLELIRAAGQSNQRYFPCYKNRTDNIVGYIDIEDLFKSGDLSLKQILLKPVFFPEVKKLPELLYSMVQENLDVVFLCDEYGGISGIVTHQQIASEILGMIPGNINTIKEDVRSLDKNTFIAPGNTDLEYLSHIINQRIKKENNETLGGYLCEKLGSIPDSGTEYNENQIRFTVLEADQLTIRSVRIELIPTLHE
ncbi:MULTISPECIES: hemolysin family protein [unclassified Oceanispirochaeta]|uniref:hemolysin family protein n=1 Tax=unclassified Oceanispirochaeta TaxID=2635722 RepID=UPI000E08E76F|nr:MULTISPECIES: hemolysin family protein [unclassified Oceanispirochaeta]MBF9016744.1 HlyC/CorC family transporter [Oceanispirochaeta sp. M2]NPD72014.1 HlyC/CorC family transporter [Oceanispirochaeta sp. M1]RDG32458.1 HlyC/CorC family transporter [Oceanispirochaeta sp. M1]